MKKILLPITIMLLLSACGGETDESKVSINKSDEQTVDSVVEESPEGNVVIAIFKSDEMGDLEHLIFTDEMGEEYDFGAGDNNLNGFEFGLDKMNTGLTEANPDLLGKKFKIVWKNKKSKTYAEDMTTLIEIDVPSIVSIELME